MGAVEFAEAHTAYRDADRATTPLDERVQAIRKALTDVHELADGLRHRLEPILIDGPVPVAPIGDAILTADPGAPHLRDLSGIEDHLDTIRGVLTDIRARLTV